MREKKRLNKEEAKYIDWYIKNICETFTAGDITRSLCFIFNKIYNEDLIRKHLKENLNMRFRKATPKPRVFDVQKLSMIWAKFWYKMPKHIDENVLLINMDEWNFNLWINNNRGWFRKGKVAEVFSSSFIGSWYIILAITFEGDY